MFKRGRWVHFTLIAAIFLFSGCSDESKKESAEESKQKSAAPVALLPVEFIQVKKQKVPIWMRFNGTTKASNKQTLQARTRGRLKKVYFVPGQTVKEGDKLFEIEHDTLKSQYNASKASLEAGKANLNLAIADLARYAPLARDGLIPRQKYEQQEAQVEMLKAKVAMDEAILEEKRTNLGYSTVTAPISGTISRSFVDVGNLVGYSGPTDLTTIVAENPMYAYFNPSEEEIQLIRKYRDKKKMDALVIVPTKNIKLLGERRLRGEVDFSNSLVNAETSTITSRAIFANPDLEVFPGTFVIVALLVTDKIDILTVPKSAIQRDQIAQYVFVIDDKDEIHRRNINTAYETKQFKVVKDGLQSGDRVVVNNFIRVKNDMKVSAIDVTDTKGVMAILKEKDLLDIESKK
jgi:RND family efflux transporter MFP subunit